MAMAIGLAALAVPGSAGAATTIGETFAPNTTCGSGTILQTQSPGGQYAIDSPGVITAWSFQALATPPTQLRLKVARPAPGDDYFTIVAHSDVQAPTTNRVSTYPTRISVQPGDIIGFFFSPDSETCSSVPVDSGYSIGYYGAAGVDVQPGTPQFFIPQSGVKLDISATLEPDADNDGFGDETQDRCPLEASDTGGPCSRTLTLDANKGKVEKKKKVRLSGQLEATGNDAACESGQTIEILRTGLKGGTPAPVTTVQTDAQGNFATKVKVKKSSLYTARTSETAGCEQETSDTEKVRVQKSKAAKEA